MFLSRYSSGDLIRSACRHGTLARCQASGAQYLVTRVGQEISACTRTSPTASRGTLAKATIIASAMNGKLGIRNRAPMLLK